MNKNLYKRFTDYNIGDIAYKLYVYYKNDNTNFINNFIIVLYEQKKKKGKHYYASVNY